ncbi:MAG: hypothetical protein WEF86_10325 [Gemmatimonadota bacterium]
MGERMPSSEPHPELEHWRTNVGDAVHVDGVATAADRLDGVDVLCWNVAIGLGRLDALLDQLRAGAFGAHAPSAERPLVILLQEAFRVDPSIPGTARSHHHGGRAPAARPTRRRSDVVEFARQAELSLYFAPSMRNGAHASDRGNAILSTARLVDADAHLLPYVRQRRVVVSAALDGHPRLRFMSAHLDTHGRSTSGTGRSRPGSGRASQARALATLITRAGGSTVLGADLNSVLGMSDPAVSELVRAGMHPARRVGAWRHTFHTPFKLLVDHVMFRCTDARITSAEVLRLDEAPRDRSRSVFGSDHHPLLARIDFKRGT